MPKMLPTGPFDDISSLVGQVENAVSKVKDPALRKVAFELVLAQALRDPARQASRHESPTSDPTHSRKSKRPRVGPVAYVERLVSDGLFSTPRSLPEIAKELAERGRVLRQCDLTYPLATLMKRKVLRRKRGKPAGGGKARWLYSTW